MTSPRDALANEAAKLRLLQHENDGIGNREPPPPRFRLLTDLELEQMPPITFLVDGVLPTEGLAAIYGPPSAGKSFLALDMACAVATGSPWLGKRTRQGSVVYIAAEGRAGLQQRLRAWKEQQGLVDMSIPVFFITEAANLLQRGDLAALLMLFSTMDPKPALIIIDTLHRSMPGGDENSAKDVGLVIEHADQLRKTLNCAVMLVHHSALNSERERGSSSLRGAVDALMFAKKDEAGGRVLKSEKAKDWPDFPDIGFELRLVGNSCVVRALEFDGSFEVDAATPAMLDAATILSRDFPTRGATSTEWLKATGLPDRTYYRVRSDLVRMGYVTEPEVARGGRYRITDSGRNLVTAKLPRTCHEPADRNSSLLPCCHTPLGVAAMAVRADDDQDQTELLDAPTAPSTTRSSTHDD